MNFAILESCSPGEKNIVESDVASFLIYKSVLAVGYQQIS